MFGDVTHLGSGMVLSCSVVSIYWSGRSGCVDKLNLITVE